MPIAFNILRSAVKEGLGRSLEYNPNDNSGDIFSLGMVSFISTPNGVSASSLNAVSFITTIKEQTTTHLSVVSFIKNPA